MKIKNTFFCLCLTFSCLLFQSCKEEPEDPVEKPERPQDNSSTIVPKGAREIGFDILGTTPASTFDDNIALAKEAGGTFMILGLGWDQIETTTPSDCSSDGTYTDPYNALSTFNSLLPTVGLKLSLSIFPIATNINHMPTNLRSKDFDDPLVICRFNKMLDYVFSKIPDVELVSFQFGNEIDLFPASNQVSFWSQYWSFFSQVQAKAKTIRSGLKTSIVSTMYGVTGLSDNPLAKEGLKEIYNIADAVVITYYPLNSDFTVKDPAVVDSDFSALVRLYPDKPIYFNEIGFPSGGAYCNSSDQLQSSFVIEMFKSWDKYSTNIKKVSFLRLNDSSEKEARDQAVLYGLDGNEAFVEYLKTLGLRTYSGADKPALIQLKTEAKDRGW